MSVVISGGKTGTLLAWLWTKCSGKHDDQRNIVQSTEFDV